jgi:hypothetical protein
MNTRSREDQLALAAAEDILADIREVSSMEDLVTKFNGLTFAVEGLTAPPGFTDHGEVIIITDETPDESAYGRDMEAPAGPDGVDLNGDGDRVDLHSALTPDCAFPVHLDNDTVNLIDNVAAADMDLVPVVVLVRWRTPVGIARLQLVTFVVDRDEY